jgi:hypothetical protein
LEIFFSKSKNSEVFFAKNEKESPYFQYHKIGKIEKEPPCFSHEYRRLIIDSGI